MSKLDSYYHSRNDQERYNSILWLTTFGIQSVVDLRPSDDLFPIISRHIEGIVDIEQTRKELREFYKRYHQSTGDDRVHRSEESDKVSVRIMEILLNSPFDLSFETFSNYHHHMFHGIYHHSGELREKPFSKKEWVLGNSTILYPRTEHLRDRLDYLFALERETDTSKLLGVYKLRHHCEFIANLFLMSPFQYANSRVSFVYALKYMMAQGYKLRNDTFYREAWYFRNAIIRAFYTNMYQGIYPTTEYMEMFWGNLLLGEDNTLKNHRMVIRGE